MTLSFSTSTFYNYFQEFCESSPVPVGKQSLSHPFHADSTTGAWVRDLGAAKYFFFTKYFALVEGACLRHSVLQWKGKCFHNFRAFSLLDGGREAMFKYINYVSLIRSLISIHESCWDAFFSSPICLNFRPKFPLSSETSKILLPFLPEKNNLHIYLSLKFFLAQVFLSSSCSPPTLACWSPRTTQRAPSPYPKGKLHSHPKWCKSQETYLHQWSHPEVTANYLASFASPLCFIYYLRLLKSHIRHCKCKCSQQNSGSKMICSLKCGFRKTLHKTSAAKNLYWLTGKKMPSHQITRLKGSIQFSKLKLYNTDHCILSSLFCIQGNHSHMTKAYFPERASLERFIIIPFLQNYSCCIYTLN